MSNPREDRTKNDKPSSENKQESKQAEESTGFIDKAQESLESSAEVVKEKIGEIADKSVDTAGEVYESVKKGVFTAFDTGSKVLDDLTKSAQEYVDRFNQNMEIRKLSEQRKKLATQLGQTTYINYKVNQKIPQKLTAEKNIVDLIVKIKNLDKEIVKLGKKLGK